MAELWKTALRRAKTMVAAGLFMALVVLAAAVVMSAAALGISALATAHSGATPEPVSASEAGGGAAQTGLSGTSEWNVSPPMAGSSGRNSGEFVSSVDELNDSLAQMHSPVTAALDSGGVVLGERVHDTFGRFLARLLETLFVAEPDTTH
jgi:Spy/CpxP family protein refolding chaperone